MCKNDRLRFQMQYPLHYLFLYEGSLNFSIFIIAFAWWEYMIFNRSNNLPYINDHAVFTSYEYLSIFSCFRCTEVEYAHIKMNLIYFFKSIYLINDLLNFNRTMRVGSALWMFKFTTEYIDKCLVLYFLVTELDTFLHKFPKLMDDQDPRGRP